MADQNTVLEVKDLMVHFKLDEGLLKAVDGVSFTLYQGKTLGLVGESGCGKSVTNQAVLRIVPHPGRIKGQILLHRMKGKQLSQPADLVKFGANSGEMRGIRGGEIGMIFQEPMKAFSPVHTIANQMTEGIMLHREPDPKRAREIALDALINVGMSDPKQRLNEYPHQLSGGMRQRAMIAMALACNPSILIADEPTTALDVTVQAQVLALINELKQRNNSSVIFITHDLGVIAEMSDYVAVMYLGKIVEYADVDTIFHDPRHPYTRALLNSIPSIKLKAKSDLRTIEGTVPFPMNMPPGCGFSSRCEMSKKGRCDAADINMVDVGGKHMVRCIEDIAMNGCA